MDVSTLPLKISDPASKALSYYVKMPRDRNLWPIDEGGDPDLHALKKDRGLGAILLAILEHPEFSRAQLFSYVHTQGYELFVIHYINFAQDCRLVMLSDPLHYAVTELGKQVLIQNNLLEV